MTLIAFAVMMFGGPLLLISFVLLCGWYKVPLYGKDYNRCSEQSPGESLVGGKPPVPFGGGGGKST